jgi:hypothetical protein
MTTFDCVNFDSIDYSSDDDIKQNNIIKSVYEKNGKPIEYNNTTMEFYRVLREKKMDAIMQRDDFDSTKAFKFPYQWDPYTGERTIIDPFGPLYFFPDDLIYFFHTKRLDTLWKEPSDEQMGYYEGCYGDGLGSGENIFIQGRGSYPELYLFRLPVTDCYLTNDHNMSFVTMGPKLTLDELIEIDKLAETHYKDYYMKTNKRNRPSLEYMKKLYDVALDPNAYKALQNFLEKNNKSKHIIIPPDSEKMYSYKTNMFAVDKLRKL